VYVYVCMCVCVCVYVCMCMCMCMCVCLCVLVYGVSPTPMARPILVGAFSPYVEAIQPDDTSGWGEPSTAPISWGRPDLPPNPDEGKKWSNISDTAARAECDLSKGSASPPSPAVVTNLFSDRGEGFSLLNLFPFPFPLLSVPFSFSFSISLFLSFPCVPFPFFSFLFFLFHFFFSLFLSFPCFPFPFLF
jgi:hypothetical protein